jgi:hypothetical protein
MNAEASHMKDEKPLWPLVGAIFFAIIGVASGDPEAITAIAPSHAALVVLLIVICGVLIGRLS